MPDIKFSQLAVATDVSSADLIPIIDASNPLMSEDGSNATISVGDLSRSILNSIAPGTLNSSVIAPNPTFTGNINLSSSTTIGAISSEEISYLNGLRSNLQTQLDENTLSIGTVTTAAVASANIDGVPPNRVLNLVLPNAAVPALTIVPRTASFTLSDSETNRVITVDSSTDVTVTIPENLSAGFSCMLIQLGAGTVSFAPDSGLNLISFCGLAKTAGPGAPASIIHLGNSSYNLSGNLTT